MKGCRPLTDAEVEAVTGGFSGPLAARNRALFLLGTKSGFRISELLSLRLGALLQFGQLVQRVTVERRHMKRQVEGRTILLHPAAKWAVREWISQMRARGLMTEDIYLFHSERAGNQAIGRGQAWRILKRAFREQRLMGKVATHSMRKTFAARVYGHLNHDLIKLQRAMGHRALASTAAYLGFCQEEIDRAILES